MNLTCSLILLGPEGSRNLPRKATVADRAKNGPTRARTARMAAQAIGTSEEPKAAVAIGALQHPLATNNDQSDKNRP